MPEKLWTIREVVELFELEERFLTDLEDEEIVCPIRKKDSPRKLFSDAELEKLRIAKLLVEDMGVNLAGVEVILRMRQNMIEMRRQFDTILEELVKELQRALKDRPTP
jgi:MerR family transcriptional regulator/heat shock protein HspR